MTIMLEVSETEKTQNLAARILSVALGQNERVQFLVDRGAGAAVAQRIRVAVSRSRNRMASRGKKLFLFKIRHEVYPYTTLDGKRHDAVVMWCERDETHLHLEILDDLMER